MTNVKDLTAVEMKAALKILDFYDESQDNITESMDEPLNSAQWLYNEGVLKGLLRISVYMDALRTQIELALERGG